MDLTTGVKLPPPGSMHIPPLPFLALAARGLAAEWPNSRGDLSPLLPGHYVTIDR